MPPILIQHQQTRPKREIEPIEPTEFGGEYTFDEEQIRKSVQSSLENIDGVLQSNEYILDELKSDALEKEKKSGYFLGAMAVESAGVFRLDSLAGEKETRQRYQEFLGGIAMHQAVMRQEADMPRMAHRSVLDVMRDAARGDQKSVEALMWDARTHVAEIRGGLGNLMKVELEVEKGTVTWSGQTTEERQFHTLTSYPNQDPAIRAGVHAEHIAARFLEDRRRDGAVPDGINVLDISVVPEASVKELDDFGYDASRMSCYLRANCFKGDNLSISSVAVGGVDERTLPPRTPGESESRERLRKQIAAENRFDIRVVRKMHLLLGGKDTSVMSPAQILESPLAVPDADVVDIVMLYDDLAAEEVEDAKTFFGSVELWQQIGAPKYLTRQHYEDYLATTKVRQAQDEELCRRIVDEQVKRGHEATTPEEAVKLKSRVVTDFMIEDVVFNDLEVDTSRFGREAEQDIIKSRKFVASGQHQAAISQIRIAKEKAVDFSCPPPNKRRGDNPEDIDDPKKGDKEEEDCVEVKDGQLVNCPYCKRKVRAIVPKGEDRIYCSNSGCDAAHSTVKK